VSAFRRTRGLMQQEILPVGPVTEQKIDDATKRIVGIPTARVDLCAHAKRVQHATNRLRVHPRPPTWTDAVRTGVSL